MGSPAASCAIVPGRGLWRSLVYRVRGTGALEWGVWSWSTVSLSVCLRMGGGEGSGPCPGRAAHSLGSSAQISSCAELSLRKTGPEPDRWFSQGHGSGLSFSRTEGRAHLRVCRAGTQALRGADTVSSWAYACTYTSASPGLHAGDSGNMRGSGVLWEPELLFTHRSSFTICHSQITIHHSPRRWGGVKGIPFSPLPCAFSLGWGRISPGLSVGTSGESPGAADSGAGEDEAWRYRGERGPGKQ